MTLLALGNGAPDIFSVIAAINNDDPFATSLAFQELFGKFNILSKMIRYLPLIPVYL